MTEGDHYPNSFSEYHILRLVGKGSFGRVFQARTKSGKIVAIKRISKRLSRGKKIEDRVRNEGLLHGQLRHQSILTLYTYFEDESADYFVLELCENGDLRQFMRRHAFREPQVRKAFKQLAEGLHYMHRRHIIHRDIKPSNLLLNSNLDLKIADFGLSKQLTEFSDPCHTVCGTPNYISPEILTKKPYGPETDLWSLGVVLFFLVTGRFPVENQEIYKKIDVNWRCSVPDHVNPHARDLILQLMHPDPTRRLPTIGVLSHPFLTYSDYQGPYPSLPDPRPDYKQPIYNHPDYAPQHVNSPYYESAPNTHPNYYQHPNYNSAPNYETSQNYHPSQSGNYPTNPHSTKQSEPESKKEPELEPTKRLEPSTQQEPTKSEDNNKKLEDQQQKEDIPKEKEETSKEDKQKKRELSNELITRENSKRTLETISESPEIQNDGTTELKSEKLTEPSSLAFSPSLSPSASLSSSPALSPSPSLTLTSSQAPLSSSASDPSANRKSLSCPFPAPNLIDSTRSLPAPSPTLSPTFCPSSPLATPLSTPSSPVATPDGLGEKRKRKGSRARVAKVINFLFHSKPRPEPPQPTSRMLIRRHSSHICTDENTLMHP